MPNAQELIRALMASPEEQQAVAQASQAAATHLRRPDLRGIQYGSQPDVRAARDAGLGGIAGTIASMHPLAQAGSLINALSTSANAGEPTPQAAAGKNNRLQELDALISEQIAQKNMAMKKAETQNQSSERYKGDDGKWHTKKGTTTVKPTEEEAKRLGEPFDKLIANYQKERESLLPWMQTAPTWERELINHAPEISFGFGTGAGLLNKGQLKSMLIGGAGSLGEGLFASTWPTVQDAHLPENAPSGIEARKNLHDQNWWLNNVLPETGEAALLGTIGGKTGNMARQAVGQAAGGLKGAAPWSWRGKTMTTNQPQPPAPAPQAAPQAPAPQRPWNTPQVAPFGKGIGRGGAYYNPVPQGGAPPQAPLTPQELAILLRHAKK